jgi:1-acyl-sn-glycerol-3-phosphate acyltransferase
MTFAGTLKYYIKYIYYCIATTFLSSLVVPFCIFRPRNANNLKWISYVQKTQRKPLGLKYEFRGMKNLQKDYTCIIVANHQSSIGI